MRLWSDFAYPYISVVADVTKTPTKAPMVMLIG